LLFIETVRRTEGGPRACASTKSSKGDAAGIALRGSALSLSNAAG
jgi:hypothetical protein